MTFAQKRRVLLADLKANGWDVREYDSRTGKPLKVAHATAGDVRLWFKPQAVWCSVGPHHKISFALSIAEDMREHTFETLVACAMRFKAWVQVTPDRLSV